VSKCEVNSQLEGWVVERGNAERRRMMKRVAGLEGGRKAL